MPLDFSKFPVLNSFLSFYRSLVPGGVAQQDGRLIPGDRLMYVNEVNLAHASLDEAVQALKGANRGIVKIGVSKPLPVPDSGSSNTTLSQEDTTTQSGKDMAGKGDNASSCADDNTEVRSEIRYTFSLIKLNVQTLLIFTH